jgi:hypothetical protein
VLALAREAEDVQATAQALINVQSVRQALGQRKGLTELLDEARALALEVGDQEVLAAERVNRGTLLASEGNLHEGACVLAESVPMWLQQGNLSGLTNAVNGLIDIACDTQQAERGAHLLGALQTRLGGADTGWAADKSELGRVAARVRALLHPARFEAACATGRSFREIQLIAEANQIAAFA